MAGTISLSLSQQFNARGEPLSGGLLYFYAAGTTTPQLAYQDSALSIAHPWPLLCDSAGRLPQFFLADGPIKIRMTDSAGVAQIAADGILVIGPSSGEGGGSSVDATTIFDTGDVKVRYGTGSHSGWVRANGRTIGSSTSGATERANSDTQSLFEYLWGADANLSVSGGRGASANADWVANKTIALPDWRGRAIAGLGDMGNSDNGLLGGLTFTRGNATTLGSLLGAAKTTIAQSNLPGVNFTVTIPAGQGGHTHGGGLLTVGVASADAGVGGLPFGFGSQAAIDSATLPAMSGTADSGGSGTAMTTVSPSLLTTLYLKL